MGKIRQRPFLNGCCAGHTYRDLVLPESQETIRRGLRFVRQSIEQRKPVYVSAISLIETVYLLELGRIPFETWNLLDAALKDTASGLSLTPVDAAIAEAVYRIPRNAVPDMPDRIIGATALHMKSRLVTRDARLRAAGIDTVW